MIQRNELEQKGKSGLVAMTKGKDYFGTYNFNFLGDFQI